MTTTNPPDYAPETRKARLAGMIAGDPGWQPYNSQYTADLDRVMRLAGLTCTFAQIKAVADANGHIFPSYIKANPTKFIPEQISELAADLYREYAHQFAPQFIDVNARQPALTF